MIKRIESGISGRALHWDYLSRVKNSAFHLGLKGVVFKRNDGSIKVIAEGEDQNLLKFTANLEKGGVFSSTENFYVKWHEPSRDLGEFYLI